MMNSNDSDAIDKLCVNDRLKCKAMVADTKTFVTKSLGQMTREERHKLLYGDKQVSSQ